MSIEPPAAAIKCTVGYLVAAAIGH